MKGIIMQELNEYRNFLKSNFKELHNIRTDQQKNLPQPELQKPPENQTESIALPDPLNTEISTNEIELCISSRKSRRQFSHEALSLPELSYLLWATQGVREVITRDNKAYVTLRTVPSAGARHPFETYLIVHRVDKLEPGIYRYLAIEHRLLRLFSQEDLENRVIEATFGQQFAGLCNVVFAWTCLPYRSEWRYHSAAHKTILLDAGHLCQNLYLACEALDLGTCAIAAYDQEKMDSLLRVDGSDEFTVYLAPAGKTAE